MTKGQRRIMKRCHGSCLQLKTIALAVVVVIVVGVQYSQYLRLDRVVPTSATAVMDSMRSNNHSIKTIEWNWHHYDVRDNSKHSPKSLVAQYAGIGNDYKLLMQTSLRANHAYARRHAIDLVELRGVPIGVKPEHATNSKIAILEAAMEQDYKTVLIMDADALVVNHTMDISKMVPEDVVFLAHKVEPNDDSHTHNINIGVTIWNLKHPKAKALVTEWRQKVQVQINEGRFPEDQAELQWILQARTDRAELVFARHDLFLGQVILHVMRSNHLDWSNPTQERLQNLQAAVALVCKNNQYCS